MEHWLSIDLSSPRGTIALHQDGKFVEERVVGEAFDHSEKVLVAIEGLLKAHELALNQVARFITPYGPGSFTGLRIAFSTLKAFFQGLRRPIETLNGSECRYLAANAPGRVLVVSYATYDKVVLAEFQEGNLISEKVFQGNIIDGTSFDLMITEERLERFEISGKTMKLPLSAKLLGDFLLQAKTRKTFATWEEIALASPQYFGASKF